VYAHLPLIHGPDGTKFSKRHGAPAVSDYRDLGYLPEAIRNYLLRLCWAHGDDEIISTEQAVAWFDFGGIGKSPARFDFAKLNHVNAHYIGLADNRRLVDLAKPFFREKLERDLTEAESSLLEKALADIKPRVQTLREIADTALFYFRRLPPDDKAKKLLTPEAKTHLKELAGRLPTLPDFSAPALESLFRDYAGEKGLKLGAAAQPLRAALTGRAVSPPIFSVAALLGRDEVLARLKGALE